MGLFGTRGAVAQRTVHTPRGRPRAAFDVVVAPGATASPAKQGGGTREMRQPGRFLASGRRLGSGAYGTVLHGVDLATDAPVAIKCILDGRMKPSSLEREVALLTRLGETGHPALLRFHGHLRPEEVSAGAVRAASSAELPMSKPLDQCHALVMEMAEGGEVFEYVVKRDGLSESELGPMFAQLVDAVGAAHRLGIAHRDLKLENVLLAAKPAAAKGAAAKAAAADGAARRIKLIDWGLAHQHALDEDGAPVPERLYTRCGSRSYMAPEVTDREISGTVGYDAFAADAWSLGVCLFAMLLGFFPFEQANPALDWRARRALEAQQAGRSTMHTIFSFYPEKPLARSLSRSVVALLDRLLVFDPTQRATIAEVCASEWLAPFAGWLTPQLGGVTLARSATASESSTCSSLVSSTREARSTSNCSVATATAAEHAEGAARCAELIRAVLDERPHAEQQDSGSTVHSHASTTSTASSACAPRAPMGRPPHPSPQAPLAAPTEARARAESRAARREHVLPEKRRSHELSEAEPQPCPTVVVAGGRVRQMQLHAERSRQRLKAEGRSSPHSPFGEVSTPSRHSAAATTSSRRLASLFAKACLRPSRGAASCEELPPTPQRARFAHLGEVSARMTGQL